MIENDAPADPMTAILAGQRSRGAVADKLNALSDAELYELAARMLTCGRR